VECLFNQILSLVTKEIVLYPSAIYLIRTFDHHGRLKRRDMADTAQHGETTTDEAELRALIERWSKAVREQDYAGIRADHDDDMLMFDVPPPFLSRGLDAYMATWDTFFSMTPRLVQFDFRDIEITAGNDVAFASAIGHCRDLSSGEEADLDFRLTMGFRKQDGQWRIMHEHHSIPATA
jgi:uncharacterized protein (TIGR02246 family)